MPHQLLCGGLSIVVKQFERAQAGQQDQQALGTLKKGNRSQTPGRVQQVPMPMLIIRVRYPPFAKLLGFCTFDLVPQDESRLQLLQYEKVREAELEFSRTQTPNEVSTGIHGGIVDGLALCRMFNQAIRMHPSRHGQPPMWSISCSTFRDAPTRSLVIGKTLAQSAQFYRWPCGPTVQVNSPVIIAAHFRRYCSI